MDDNALKITRNVLFVDDERRVLQGLKRMLRPQRHEWASVFAESGREALEILEKDCFDVVVSDMRMPGMNGIQLLSEVKKRYPHIVRIILSGESDQNLTMQAVNISHQFINKPCNADTLKAVISRTCRLSRFLQGNLIKRRVSGIDMLPSLPSVYSEIMNELQSPDASIRKVGKIISKDMAMTAKILQLVNSAYFC
ncbi:MAG: response regulator, partial [Deltaproteobacteria bacterium]|nr:response regulator [Deltaproteobacteria bacterium]